MKYEEPKMHILVISDEDIVRTSWGLNVGEKLPTGNQDSGKW